MGTLVVSGILIIVVGLIISSMVKKHRKAVKTGMCSCNCSCSCGCSCSKTTVNKGDRPLGFHE